MVQSILKYLRKFLPWHWQTAELQIEKIQQGIPRAKGTAKDSKKKSQKYGATDAKSRLTACAIESPTVGTLLLEKKIRKETPSSFKAILPASLNELAYEFSSSFSSNPRESKFTTA